MQEYILGIGYVNTTGKWGKYTLGIWQNISLSGVKDPHQTKYNTIALQIPDSLDPQKRYVLILKEEK